MMVSHIIWVRYIQWRNKSKFNSILKVVDYSYKNSKPQLFVTKYGYHT